MWTKERRGWMGEISRKIKRFPSDLTDEEWERIKPVAPMPPKRGRKPAVDLREILNAIRTWRSVPTAGGCRRPILALADGGVVPAPRAAAAVPHHP
jgi:hypothetical protein